MTFIGRFFRGGSGEPARIVGGKLARIVSVKGSSDEIPFEFSNFRLCDVI